VDYDQGHSGALSFNTTKVTYSGGENGTCSTSSCHNQGSEQSASWDLSTSLDCSDCHYWDSTVADSAANKSHAASLSATHNKHFDKPYQCTECHNDNFGDKENDPLGHVTGTALSERAVATSNEALVIVATWDSGSNSCSNAACHDPSNAAYAATWMVSDSTDNCALCHSESDPGTGGHSAHLDASVAGTFGIDSIGCTSCHVDNSGNTDHLNGSVNFSGVTYSLSSCDTNACHNLGDGTAPATDYTWGNSYASCTLCHLSPNTFPETGDEGARHVTHIGNTTYVSGSCGECHLANANNTSMGGYTSHINGTVNLGGTSNVSGYSSATGDCTNDCHNVDTAVADWIDAAALDCTNCHGALGKDLDRGWAPTSGRHGVHRSNTSYVDSNIDDCVDCHNDNWSGHSTLDNVVTSVTAGSQISDYNARIITGRRACVRRRVTLWRTTLVTGWIRPRR
jgi:predicted CxxxxCH...CXXCH cytochrome family protein